MGDILKDSDTELVIAIRSSMVAWTGGLGIFSFLYLMYLLIIPGHTSNGQIVGFAGAFITCTLVFLVFYEKSDFSFDRLSRTLTWSRQRGFFRYNGTVPFTSIESVALQSCLGNDKYYHSHRVVLITQNGELPLMVAYEHDDTNEALAERIRYFLERSMEPDSDDARLS